MTLTAANPVGEAVYGVLQDSTLQALVEGRVFAELPPDVAYPCVYYELFREQDIRGFGTGGLPEVDLRTHVFTTRGGGLSGAVEAHEINRQVVALLKDADLTVTGYQQCGRVFYRETVALNDEEIAGVRVHEVVSLFTVYVEELAA
jgi:hypothetical protein